jgi:hypothetical protein
VIESDPAINPGISLRTSVVKYIDEHRVGHGYKNRSDYIQTVVLRDLNFSRIDYISELMGMMILPMLFFCFFMILAVITTGIIFYLLMGVSGMFAVFLSVIYTKKHRKVKI